ncbi:MAG TPA: HigA family addiction module antitoxin [Lichenihabitans sp.]|jgi:addiction module HigA family antidote|nr:HigA family addiction module antitoxin [Lichenihabitans sp.]
MTAKLSALHPGEILREEFLVPLGLSAGKVARSIGVPRTRVERIVAEQTGISADTAVRLERLFGASAQFWMNAQAAYDLETAQTAIGDKIAHIARHNPQAA